MSGSDICENARRDDSSPSAAPPMSNVRRAITGLPVLTGILELYGILWQGESISD